MSRLKCCNKCGQWKDREQDFLKKKHQRRLVDGTIKIDFYISSECRLCNADRVAAWKEKKKAEGVYADYLRRWAKARDPQKRKKYCRQWYRKRRGSDLHHVWSKYEKELASLFAFDAVKLAKYIDRFVITDPFDGEYYLNGVSMLEAETHQLNRWRTGGTKKVALAQADKWATRFDLPLWEFEEVAMIAA